MMVRTYKRKTSSTTTPASTMQEAAQAVVTGEKTLREAAKDFDIPKTTLGRYVRKMRQPDCHANIRFCPNYCVRQIFSDVDESMLNAGRVFANC
jgi:hypothetical protein